MVIMGISWFGKVAVLKMKILPKFIFVFRNLILQIPRGKFKLYFPNLFGERKKPRTKMSTGRNCSTNYSTILSGGTVRRDAILQWWNLDNKESWEWEQENVLVPLREWILNARDYPLPVATNVIVNILCKFWKTVQRVLSTGISPLASFMWHLDFHEVMKVPNSSYGWTKG